MKALRYIAIIPASLLGWLTAFLIGVEALDLAVLGFCPSELREGYDCYAHSWQLVEDCIIAVFAGISAFLTIGFGVRAAPARKTAVALYIYIVGSIIALVLAITMKLLLWPCSSALIMGFIAMRIVQVRAKEK